MFDLLRQQPSFVEEAERVYSPKPSNIEVALTPDPWSLLDDDTYEEVIGQRPPEKYAYATGCPLSAATIALHFLRVLSTVVHSQLRRVVLLEDDECAAFPASHRRGFIPIC